MENVNQTNDLLAQQRPKELPGMLNVLTILTFIGCGLGFIFTILGYVFTNNASDKLEKMSQAGASQNQIDMFMKSAENRSVLLISGLIFTTLCLIGAIQMRRFKKPGFYLYVVGEFGPLVVSAGLLGFSVASDSVMSIISMIIGTAIPVIFVILYSTQLKYLK